MTGSAEGIALSVGEPRQIIPIAFPDRETEERLRAVLSDAGGKDLSVRIEPAEQPDVEGNTMGAALRSVWVNVRVGAGDTVLPAISVHFPTADEAALFRRRLIAAGLLAGTIAVASAGAIGLANMPTTSSVATPASRDRQARAQRSSEGSRHWIGTGPRFGSRSICRGAPRGHRPAGGWSGEVEALLRAPQ